MLCSYKGYVNGYGRRFWQGSTDHRGVPGAPGRVVTLIHRDELDSIYKDDEEELRLFKEQRGWLTSQDTVHERTFGMVYEISEQDIESVTDYLDFREKGGYVVETVTVYLLTSSSTNNSNSNSNSMLDSVQAQVYIATAGNENFLGPAPHSQIVRQIRESHGPSGANLEYLVNLIEAIRELFPDLYEQGFDPHLSFLESLLQEK